MSYWNHLQRQELEKQRAQFWYELTTPDWQRTDLDLTDTERMILKWEWEKTHNPEELEKQNEYLRISKLSDEHDDRHLIKIEDPEDRYKVIVHRSNEYFKFKQSEIYKKTGLFVSDHEGFYALYTKKEMRKQFPKDKKFFGIFKGYLFGRKEYYGAWWTTSDLRMWLRIKWIVHKPNIDWNAVGGGAIIFGMIFIFLTIVMGIISGGLFDLIKYLWPF